MNISSKVLVLVASVFVLLGIAELYVDRVILEPSFAELERDDARTAIRRVSFALDQRLKSLGVSAAGWGNWSETYRFVQDHNPEFLTINMSDTTLKQLDVSVMLLIDIDGNFVFKQAVDLQTNRPLQVDLLSQASLPADFPWRRKIREGLPAQGLVQTDQGVMMLAASPILDGNEGGPTHGMVILGRILSAGEIQQIGSQAQESVSMAIGDEHLTVDRLLETTTTTRVSHSVADIYGRPVMTLGVEVPRRITARGRSAVAYSSAYLIGAAVIVLAILVIFLHRTVLAPLAKVTRHAVAIGAGKDLSARLHMRGSDEIAILARELDCMVERIAESRGQLETHVKDLEAAASETVRAKEAAESANRAKSDFLANMSHEIRTPMNGVLGMTAILLDTNLDAMQRDYAQTIRDSGASLLTVINDILDFSKVEAGKLELEHVEISLRDTFEDVARLVAIQAHAKGLELTSEVDPDLPALATGDAGRFRQVLLNFAGNAVKFTEAGEVSLEIKVIETDRTGTQVKCCLRDTGIGIPADRVARLYAPFTQVDSSTTRRFGGTGLGLSIAKRLVSLMGGETGVESVEGKGSLFWFTARFGRVDRASFVPQGAPAPVKGRRILVVDDNATNRNVLMGQLQVCGVEPMAAGAADEALLLMHQAAAAGRPYDAALLDHRMPGCDGPQLGESIMRDTSIQSTRLILLTSSGLRGDDHELADIGFCGCLQKPVTQRDLEHCLALAFATEPKTHPHRKPIVVRSDLQVQAAAAGAHILLAEDNLVNQKVATRLLEKLGHKIDVAMDGQAAVLAWEKNPYDLIFMDCQMPIMDGYEATREIRRREDGKVRIPIVALTANAMKGDDDLCYAAGMDAFVSKPIDQSKLKACLEALLTNSKPPATPTSEDKPFARGTGRGQS